MTFARGATRARIAFDAGLAALLLGLVGVALPPGKVSHFALGRWIALVIAGAAFLGEVWWLTKDEWSTAQWNRLIRRTRDVAEHSEGNEALPVSVESRDQGSGFPPPSNAAIEQAATRASPGGSTSADHGVQPARQRDVPKGDSSRPAQSDESARPPPVRTSDSLADARAHAEFQAARNRSGIGASVTRAFDDGDDRAWQCVISDGHAWHHIRLVGVGIGRWPNLSPAALEQGISRFAESLPESGRLQHLLNANPLRVSRAGIVRD